MQEIVVNGATCNCRQHTVADLVARDLVSRIAPTGEPNRAAMFISRAHAQGGLQNSSFEQMATKCRMMLMFQGSLSCVKVMCLLCVNCLVVQKRSQYQQTINYTNIHTSKQ